MPTYRSRVDNQELSIKVGEEFDSDTLQISESALADLVSQEHVVEVDSSGRAAVQKAPVGGGADNRVVSGASQSGATQTNAPTAQGARTTQTTTAPTTRATPATTAPATGSAAQTSSQSSPANTGGPTGGRT